MKIGRVKGGKTPLFAALGWCWVGVKNRLHTRAYMAVDTVWQLAFILGLVGFGIWFSHLSNKLNRGLDEISHRGDDLEEIREAVETVAVILNKLPELMPQFTMNSNPLQPLFDAFAAKISGVPQLNTVGAPHQDPESGQYASAPTQD